eukprot:7380366-Prymnesium_polylepis.1
MSDRPLMGWSFFSSKDVSIVLVLCVCVLRLRVYGAADANRARVCYGSSTTSGQLKLSNLSSGGRMHAKTAN